MVDDYKATGDSTAEAEVTETTGAPLVDPERRTILGSVASLSAWVFAGGIVLGGLRASEKVSGGQRSLLTEVSPGSLESARVVGPAVLIPEARGRVSALDRHCTHLGCLLGVSEDGSGLTCPCHGSMFDLSGRPVRGPAIRALRALRVTTDPRGKLEIHGLR